MARKHVNVPLPGGPDTWRLADMAGVVADLEWVAQMCERLAPKLDEPRADVDELEALQAAVIIRYARCYSGGRRTAFLLNHEWLGRLPERLHETHRFFDDLRDKHVAHSVNDWELNVPVAQLCLKDGEPTEVVAVHVDQHRVLLLPSESIEWLRDLAARLAELVKDEMQKERARLLEIARAIPIGELEALIAGPVVVPGRGVVGRARGRP